MKENHYLVPLHIEGLKKDIIHTVTAVDGSDACDWFVDAKEKLLDVNNWSKYSKVQSAEFLLTNSYGKGAKRNARRGDHIRTDNPANATSSAEWAIIEAIEYDDYPDADMESFAIRIRPVINPEENNLPYWDNDSDATSTFVIERRGRHLWSSYHARKEPVAAMVAANDTTLMDSADTEALTGLPAEMLERIVKGFLGEA